MPKVSVCIPAYNYANFLPDAIDSVLAQTWQDFELLVIDNCSTDDTRGVVSRYMAADPRISYVCNDTNIGPVKNLNRCLELATGEYIKILCADDLLLPECLEHMVRALDQHSTVSLVASGRKLVTSDLQPIRSLAYSFRKEHIPGAAAINRCLFSGNHIGEPTAVLFRKSDISRGFSCDYAQLVDLEMWFYLLEQGDFIFLPQDLCLFRQHAAQGTKTNLKTFNFLDDEEKLFNDFISKPYIAATPLNIFNWKFTMAWNIWGQRKNCDDPTVVKKNMDRYMNCYLFFLLMVPAMISKKILRISKKLLASGSGYKGAQ
jgi:glycosyltransferase involved in cell wall biosynthesis